MMILRKLTHAWQPWYYPNVLSLVNYKYMDIGQVYNRGRDIDDR